MDDETQADGNLEERQFTAEQRTAMAKSGHAMPDGSYPIENKADLSNAIQSFGRAKNQGAVKRHIIKRAKALGMMDMLPADWMPMMNAEDAPFLSDGALLEAVVGSDGWDWRVQIIQSGISKNRTEYPLSVLQQRAPLYEGVPAFYGRGPDHNSAERGFDSVAGWFHAPSANSRGIEATFSINHGKPHLKESFQQAWDIHQKSGKPPFGFSHVIPRGKFKTSVHRLAEGLVRRVDDFSEVESVDIVMRPSAGGELLGLVAAVDARQEQELDDMNELLRRYNAGENLSEAELSQLAREAPDEFVKAMTSRPPTVAVEDKPEPTPAPENNERLTESMSALERRLMIAEGRSLLSEKLAEAATIPAPFKDAIRADFERALNEGRFVEADLEARINRDRDMAAKLMESGNVPQPGSLNITDDQRDKHAKALDGMIAGKPIDGVTPFLTLKQAYRIMTGSKREYISEALARDVLREAASYVPADYEDDGLRESVISTTFAQVLGDSITRRMLMEYNFPQFTSWRNISSVVPLTDFRTNRRMRMGGYGNLPSVAEGGVYQPLTSPTDEEATYAPAKYGGTEDLSLEVIANDDVGVVRRIPVKLGRAAGRTLYQAVWITTIVGDAVTTYDSATIFDAAHNNSGTAALGEAGLLAAENAMRDQTAYDETASVLGSANMPRFLIIPNELRNTANKLVNSPNAVTSAETATTPNLFQGQYTVIVVDDFTDATNWYLAADPNNVPILEVGFLGGREQPELFVQDQPTVGSQFTADKTTFKIRHIWGIGVLDHRGLYRQVVAG